MRPRELVAAAGAARAYQEVVANQLAALIAQKSSLDGSKGTFATTRRTRFLIE